MTSAVANLSSENNLGTLAKSFSKLSASELNFFFDELNKNIVAVKEITAKQKEAYLLKQIKEKIPASLIQRYKKLDAKFQNGTITEKERVEILQITDSIELRSAERIPLLEALSELKQIPLMDLIKQLNLKNFHG